MAGELEQKLADIHARLAHLGESFKMSELKQREAKIGELMSAPTFWNNQEKAKGVVSELKGIKSITDVYADLAKRLEDAEVMLQLAREEKDEEARAAVVQDVEKLEQLLGDFEFKAMLNGPNDRRDAFVSIHAGAGGTESCDWAEMLMRMYTRWMERHGYQIRLVDQLEGEGAGIKSVTLEVGGPWAYGYLKSEIGVHRLVRISPFDANARRHTSFASVDVVPEFEEMPEIEIKDSDIRIERIRAGGKGGQHVNVTDSAVRITHIATGIVSQCQNERSQHQNLEMAMKVLKSRLYRLEEQKREEELSKLYGEKGEIAWGHQIRSYVLQPYQMIKDHRTDVETGNVQAVLDGDIDMFIDAYLKQRIKKA
jgi:peptide chain release factor 2